jgi:hypothetical protein
MRSASNCNRSRTDLAGLPFTNLRLKKYLSNIGF